MRSSIHAIRSTTPATRVGDAISRTAEAQFTSFPPLTPVLSRQLPSTFARITRVLSANTFKLAIELFSPMRSSPCPPSRGRAGVAHEGPKDYGQRQSALCFLIEGLYW